VKLLLRAFPAGFRQRYGAELLELVDTGDAPVRDAANLVLAGLRVRFDEAAARLRRRTGVGGHALSLGLMAVAAGGGALGGCVVLGSAAAGGAGALVLYRCRGASAFAR
jgi:hypothetical protein